MTAERRQFGWFARVRSAVVEWPLHVLLISIYPAVWLLSTNIGAVDVQEAFLPIALSALGAVVLYALLRLARLPRRRAALVVSITAVAVLMFGHAANVVGEAVARTVLLGIWLAAAAAAVVLAWRVRSDLRSVTGFLNVASAALVAVAATSIGASLFSQAEAVQETPPLGERVQPSAGSTAEPKRDIYYLMVEDYGSPRVMSQYLGLSDDGLFDWLEDAGFAVLRDTRANYGRTAHSIASSMNMIYLDEVAAAIGPESDSYAPLRDMAAESEVAAFLQRQGYTYVHLGSQWWLTAVSEMADVNPRFAHSSDFTASFIEATIIPSVTNLFGVSQATFDNRRRVYDAAIWGLETFREVRQIPGPKFVFFHLFLPHHPWVARADGSFATAADDSARTLRERMQDQWSFVSLAMRDLIDELLASAGEPEPIIVFTTDEGPTPRRVPNVYGDTDWSRASDAELDQKLGIFAAYYLPEVETSCLYPTMSSVNTFRLVFNLYFDTGLPLLPDRNYIHQDRKHLYALTDITDRLAPSSAGRQTESTC
ncbi:MAG TPA: hypothetical protein VHK63_08065 [Candidatus Limnocylindria bacterium]|nr:hypothetical protein [Candidatus Limnocylindria bacterium]